MADTDSIIEYIYRRANLLQGVTFSGGEPFGQQAPLIEIADAAHAYDLDVWCYSGYTYEELEKNKAPLLSHIDVLVDGPYIEALRDEHLEYRGSKNQRIINLGILPRGL